jgi:hypothetical protein
LARIILSHALLESIRFVMSRKERRDIYGLINNARQGGASARLSAARTELRVGRSTQMLDLIMLAIGLSFFALSIGYVYACDQL